MRPLTVAVVAALAAAIVFPAGAQEPERFREMQLQQEREQRIERAKENCRLNRGVDCDTPQGLQEWLLYDRTRMEAVLDRELPPRQPY